LLDFFPDDFITIVDESHVTLPQVRAMYKADRSRKTTLVEHGFRLPSALDNRPLMFDEFMELTKRMVFISATPGDFELSLSGAPIIQENRPTGLLDPEIECRPLKGQVDDVIAEIRECAKKDERVIVTTLTKKSAERLSDYLEELGIKVTYLHSDIDAIERMQVLTGLRRGDFTCLVGINLLREGIDLPEVGLVAILDADKEGFLRSARSLLQVAGRAARNVNGRVILYGDRKTDSMKHLINVTETRRKRQKEHNKKHGITPKTIVREIKDTISDTLQKEYQITLPNSTYQMAAEDTGEYEYEMVDTTEAITELIETLEAEMQEASVALEFERAAELRDQIKRLEKKLTR
jgi:excinuclease ABC subunit B